MGFVLYFLPELYINCTNKTRASAFNFVCNVCVHASGCLNCTHYLAESGKER